LETCIEIVKKIRNHKLFYSVYSHECMEIDFSELLNEFEVFRTHPITGDGYVTDDEARRVSAIDRQILALGALKMTFLDQSEMDRFEEEYSSTSPY